MYTPFFVFFNHKQYLAIFFTKIRQNNLELINSSENVSDTVINVMFIDLMLNMKIGEENMRI